MAITNIGDPPFHTQVLTPRGYFSAAWSNWILLELLQRVQSNSPINTSISLSEQNAAIATSSLIPSASQGVYRISWFLRITTAATTSSSVTFSVQSTDGGVAISQSGAAVTGNTTSTIQSGSFLMRADAGTAITYDVAYASNAANEAEYEIDIRIEAL